MKRIAKTIVKYKTVWKINILDQREIATGKPDNFS
jgi:hypothetical protein